MHRPLLLACTLALVAAGAARGAVWPGPAPCDDTLQACLDAAASGDVVQIAADGPIVENLDILEKSLTLEPLPGFAPTIEGIVVVSGAPAASEVTVRGLTIHGFLHASLGTGDLALRLLGNTVVLDDLTGGLAVFVSGSSPPVGELDAEIAGNVVVVTGQGGANCEGIHVGPVAAPASAVVTGNRVTISDCSQGAGIRLDAGRDQTLAADVVGNHVEVPGASNGILALNQQGTSLQARLVNNVVTGQTLRVGPHGGLVVLAVGARAVEAQVINNTLVGNERGLVIDGDGPTVSGVVANNLVAHTLGDGLVIEPILEPAVANDHNLVFGNGDDRFTPGPGTVSADPLLASASDLRLQAGSPAIDAGANARVPADIVTDIDGAPRIVGAAVDIGAYERQQLVSVVEVPGLSGAGAAALGALLALAGWLFVRRY